MDYRGYQIEPQPAGSGGNDSMWYGGYEITKDGELVSRRANIFPANLYFKSACTESIETAKTEIDNLLDKASGGVE